MTFLFYSLRTIESLYEELVHEGILVRLPKTKLREYSGEYRCNLLINSLWTFSAAVSSSSLLLSLFLVVVFIAVMIIDNVFVLSSHFSYLGTTLRQANIEPMPSLSDVRRVISEFAILPLGENEAISWQYVSFNNRRWNQILCSSECDCPHPTKCILDVYSFSSGWASFDCFLIFSFRIPSRTRESAVGQVGSHRWTAGRGKENVGALRLHGDWREYVRFNGCQHRGEISWKSWTPNDVTHGV